MPTVVRALTPADAAACEAIVAELPAYFGQEQGVLACREAPVSEPGMVADDEGSVRGFLTWRRHFPESAEITWLAVDRVYHGRGIGSQLVASLVEDLRAGGVHLLHVKTLSARHPDAGYPRTRSF